ncbi:MAG: hypothetical protein AAGH38_01675 [Pseudomonadota bacterium]
MSLTLISPPSEEPVTLVELKAHLRVDGTAEDALIAGLGVAARQAIEARFGVAMIAQTWQLALDGLAPIDIRLPIGPVTSIGPLIMSTDDGEITVPTIDYDVSIGDIGRIRFDTGYPVASVGQGSPGTAGRFDYLKVSFAAGYPTASDVPEPMKLAVKVLAAHFFEFREEAGFDRFYTSPQSLNALMAPWRRVRL